MNMPAISITFMATLIAATVAPVTAQIQLAQQAPQPGPGDEIRLDEQNSLKATALEAKMAALRANYQLILRQIQDMEAEHKNLYEERKKLIEDTGRKQRVDVKDTNEWAFDTSRQRYVKIKKTP